VAGECVNVRVGRWRVSKWVAGGCVNVRVGRWRVSTWRVSRWVGWWVGEQLKLSGRATHLRAHVLIRDRVTANATVFDAVH
jgi:hypothetical protein